MLARVRSFHRRRIALPDDIDAGSLVLDIGSGDKPHWRADVLVDRFPGAEHAVQRSGRAAARLPRPLFDADIADMPFADKVFDYAICSHVLEHVSDPGAAIAEITRVAKAGYVEVPRAASAKIIDFPSHLWWCRDDGGVLVFAPKHMVAGSGAFDAEIEGFVRTPVIERDLNALIDRHFDEWIISLRWRGELAHRVEGSVDEALVAHVATANAHHKPVETVATRLLTAMFTAPLRSRRRRQPVRYDDIVKPELRRGTSEALRAQRYRIGS